MTIQVIRRTATDPTQAISFQLREDVLDRHWISGSRVDDLLDARPDRLAVDVNLIQYELSGDFAFRSHGASRSTGKSLMFFVSMI